MRARPSCSPTQKPRSLPRVRELDTLGFGNRDRYGVIAHSYVVSWASRRVVIGTRDLG